MSWRDGPGSVALESLGRSLERVRCRQPVLVERMVSSLSMHGQLTPLVAIERAERLEVVDGFKRLMAAERMGWPSVAVTVRQADEAGQWAMMLTLNRGPHSMSELEEALVLRELVQSGLTQVEVAELVGRHKSWVSRRIGLVDRLHPELIEGMKVGLLSAGVARRLLSLPPGNQLEVAAAAQAGALGPRDTELLVALWHRAPSPEIRQYILAQPLAALRRAHPELPAPNPALTPQGRQLSKLLRVVVGVAPRVAGLLPGTPPDRALLRAEITEARQAVCLLESVLGPSENAENESGRGEPGALE